MNLEEQMVHRKPTNNYDDHSIVDNNIIMQ